VLAIRLPEPLPPPPEPISQSAYPNNEGPNQILDQNATTKYLNQGGRNSGFIVTPAAGATVVEGFRITTANDEIGRDPTAWSLYGTNDPITSTNNSTGSKENWTLIDSGT